MQLSAAHGENERHVIRRPAKLVEVILKASLDQSRPGEMLSLLP